MAEPTDFPILFFHGGPKAGYQRLPARQFISFYKDNVVSYYVHRGYTSTGIPRYIFKGTFASLTTPRSPTETPPEGKSDG